MREPQGVASLALGYVLHWAFSPPLLNPKLELHKQSQFATLPTNIKKEDSPQIDFVMSLLFYQLYSVTGAAGAVGALPFFPPRRR